MITYTNTSNSDGGGRGEEKNHARENARKKFSYKKEGPKYITEGKVLL